MRVTIDFGKVLIPLEGEQAEELVRIIESENLPPFIRVEDQGRTRFINPRYITEVIIHE